jgi:KDO2-lipid IV(A) lauroyltransferase
MIWRALARLVGWLSFAWLARLGAVLGWLAGSVLRIRRAHVEQAMARAGVARGAAPAMYRGLGAGALELLWMAARRRDLGRVAVLDGDARAAWEGALAKGRGVVVAASHTGNWDLAACAVAQRAPLLVVTKRLSMGGLDAFWQLTRAGYGVSLCEAAGAMARGRAALAAGGAVAMMIDQVPARPEHGVRCAFLGAPAFADRAPATLAARAGAPLVVAASRRDPAAGGAQRLEVLAVLDPPPRAGKAWIEEATRAATAALDAFVRAHPSEWLWMHRRWKTPSASSYRCLRAMSAQVPVGSISR